MIDTHPHLAEIHQAELERNAAHGTDPGDCRPESAPARAALAGPARAVVAGTVAVGSFAVVGTIV